MHSPADEQIGLRNSPLVLDLDGVLRIWDPAIMADAERNAGLPAGALAGCAFAPTLLHDAITGLTTDEQWRARITDQLVAEHGPGAAAAVAEWSVPTGEVDHDVLQLVRSQRGVRPVALLTNATTRLRTDLARLGVLDEFDQVFNSSELGVAKPDARVFRLVCARLGAPAERCWYVDDSPANVGAAAELGMRTHLFTDAESLHEFLSCGQIESC